MKLCYVEFKHKKIIEFEIFLETLGKETILKFVLEEMKFNTLHFTIK